ncbi:hypothetical protein [Lentzea sp.]|uniref:hypothetical protein n=1 Tax=Lentzea sp. TaxID=56099 RepID=UPI002ED30F46
MKLTRKTAAATAIAAGALALTGLTTGTASAAEDGGITVMGNAPSCVRVWVNRGTVTQTGHAKNECGYRLNLKIIWAWGADGACFSVDNGGEITSKVAIEPRVFDGASTC